MFRVDATGCNELAHPNDFLLGRRVRRHVNVVRMVVELHLQLATAGTGSDDTDQ